MRKLVAMALAGLALAGTAMADPVDEGTARKALFALRGVTLATAPDSGLTESQVAIMSAILTGLRSEDLANYYGAVAVSPDFFAQVAEDPGQAALSGLIQVTERLHSPAAADAVALAACNAARGAGQSPCVIAARILPRRWEQRVLSMSVNATRAFRDYRRADDPKAFALSRASRAYALSQGDGAMEQALADCNAAASAAGAADCFIAVTD